MADREAAPALVVSATVRARFGDLAGQRVAAGRGNHDIAAELFIAEDSQCPRRPHPRKALVANRVEAAAAAHRLGID